MVRGKKDFESRGTSQIIIAVFHSECWTIAEENHLTEKKTKVIAELVVAPFGVGTSLSKYVKESVKALDEFPELRVLHTPMSTILEADSIDVILAATKAAHERMFETGAKRVSTLLRIDDRRDKPRTMEDKVSAIT